MFETNLYKDELKKLQFRMENSKRGIIISMVLALLILQVTFKTEALNSTGGHMFPKSLKDVRKDCQLFMTPVDNTYTIWPVIFTWQFLMVLYCFTTVIRNVREAHIATLKFFYTYIGSIVCDIILSFIWSRSEYVASLALASLRTFMLCVSFGMSCYDFYQYQKENCNQENQNLTKSESFSASSMRQKTRAILLKYVDSAKKDLWCYCGFIQNGIFFYASWSLFETIYHFVIVLNQDLDATNLTSSIIGLIILLVCLIVWFCLENIRLKGKFTMYIVSGYIAFIYAVSGVYDASWDENRTVGWFSLILLFLSVIIFDIRILIIGIQHQWSTEAYGNLKLNFDETDNKQELEENV